VYTERSQSHPFRLDNNSKIGHIALKQMDNVGIVVDDLGGTIDSFRELGLKLEGPRSKEHRPDPSLDWTISAV
jgi:hypothetical protein